MDKDTIRTGFNVTFVDKDDIRIYSVSKDILNQKILYNCGDNAFEFDFDGYFNGPNYELNPVLMTTDLCENGACYFNFTKKNMTESFTSLFDFA
jgi:hypothetical protein